MINAHYLKSYSHMNSITSVLFAAVLLCVTGACVHAQHNGTNEKTISFLRQFRSDYIKSKLEATPEILSTYLNDSIRLMTEFQKTVMGRSNVLAYHKALTQKLQIKSYSRVELETLDLGLMVVEFGQFTLQGTLRSTGQQHELKGKYVNVWQRKNGKLFLITDGWNYDHQVNFSDQLRSENVQVMDVALQAHVPVKNPVSFELAALNRLQEVAISESDDDVWSQFYADDAILFCQFGSLVHGRKQIDDYIMRHAKDRPVFEKLDIRNDRIDDLGSYIIEYASHIAIWRKNEHSGVNLGKDLRVWRRAPNGSLKIFRQIGMYD